MFKNKKWFLILIVVSLLIHGVIYFFFIKTKSIAPAESVSVEVLQTTPKTPQTPLEKAAISLKDLLLGAPRSGGAQQPSQGTQPMPVPAEPSSRNSHFLEPGASFGFEKTVATQSFLAFIARRIDSGMDYPADLANQRIQGHVTVVVSMRKDGVIDGSFIKSWGESPILEAYAVAVVMALFQEPLPVHLQSKEDLPEVKLYFNFVATTIAETPTRARPLIQANRISFLKERQVESKVNEALNKFFTRIVPPIIPIPGGVIIDFVRFYEWYTSLGTPDPDKMREIRIEQLKQTLNESKKPGSAR